MKYYCKIKDKYSDSINWIDYITSFKCQFCGKEVETDNEPNCAMWCLDNDHIFEN